MYVHTYVLTRIRMRSCIPTYVRLTDLLLQINLTVLARFVSLVKFPKFHSYDCLKNFMRKYLDIPG